MTDRIYVTYTPTTAPASYHTTIHYERTDPSGNVVKHVIIEAQPENLEQLSASDKAIGVVEEAFRRGNDPSRFGRIDAQVRVERKAGDDSNAPYEIIAEGDDLSANLARMQLFAHGVNRAGFAYRGDHQNSNSFAGAALQAGELPPATGVAHDPAGPPGELSEFFAPGLNEPLRAAIGPTREAADVARLAFDNRFGNWGSVPTGVQPPASDRPELFDSRTGNWGSVPVGASVDTGSPVLRALEKYRRSAAPDGPAPTSAQGASLATPAFHPDFAGAGGVLGKFIGNGLITPAAPVSSSGPLLQRRTVPNFASEESAFGDQSDNARGAPVPDTYRSLQRVSSASSDITPRNPGQPAPPPERAPALGIFSGEPMLPLRLPPSVWGLPDSSDASDAGNLFDFLAGLNSPAPTQPSPLQATGNKPVRYLSSRLEGQSQAPAFDAGAPAVPLVPSDDPNVLGGLAGRIAALVGIDPQNPALLAPPPLDQDLLGFYRDDPAQPWFVRRQR